MKNLTKLKTTTNNKEQGNEVESNSVDCSIFTCQKINFQPKVTKS